MTAARAVRAAPAAAPRRGIGLIRVSWEKDGTTSPEIQRFAIEQHAASHSITIVDWITAADDHKYSASRNNSKWWAVLDAAIERIESRDVDALVFWKLSRTSRNRVRWAVAADRVETAGGSIESAYEPLDVSTSSGRFGRDVIVAANVLQAEVIGETWRETHDRRRRHGLPPTGGPRFGYQQVTEERSDGRQVTIRYEPDSVLAPVLVDMYRRYLGGAGAARLCRLVNEAGIPNTRGGRWTNQLVLQVLDSGFAAGLLSKTRVRVGKQLVAPPCWEREYAPGAHAPIIDAETWAAYIAARAMRATHRTRSPERYLLTGLLRCGECGGRMHGRHTQANGREYICSRGSTTSGMRKLSIRAHVVEQAIEEWVFALAEDLEQRSEARDKTRAKVATATFTTGSLEKRIARAQDRLAKLTIRLADGTVSDDAYRAAAAQIEADSANAAAQLRKIAPNPVQQHAPTRLPRELARRWSGLTPDERAEVLRPLIDRIEILPGRNAGSYTDRIRIIPSWDETADTR